MRATSLGWVLLSGIGFTASFAHTNGQMTSKSGAAKGADPYAAEAIVVERRDSAYKMAADGTGTHELTIVARIQSEAALHEAGVLNMPYAANSEHVEYVYARVRHKDGTVTETPVSGAMEVLNPVTREAPFYSDLKEMQLPVKRLGVGDTLEWQARIVRTKAEAPGEFWGQESFLPGAVVLAETVELQVPKDRYVNVWSPGKKPVETMVGDERVYRWATEQLKPTTGPEVEAEKEAKKKRVLTAEQERDEKEGKLPDVAWTTFKSWEDVGAWYRGLEGDRMVPDAEVKAKVAELTAGKTTEQEKVEAVYRYVSSNIRYIGVAFGVGRYQPHAAGVVMENQYGDCKDKHTLLAAMLEALGEHPDAVLIGAGIRFNPAVPSPAAFNHLITNVTIEGKPVWLDSTAEVAPYGLLMAVIRDHDALVVPETGAARVERTPAKLPFAQTNTMEAVGALDANGTSTSRITLTFHGDDEVVMRSVLRQISPAQYVQMAQGMCSGMGYGGTASHVEVSRADDMSAPVSVSFDYKREKGGDWANYRAIPQLGPVQLPRPDQKDPPVESLQLGVPRVESSKSAMKLPEGWGVELPEAVHVKSKWATYDETYRFEKGTMYAERRVEVLVDKVPQAEWKDYNKFAEKADLGNEQYVQLTRGGAKNAFSLPDADVAKDLAKGGDVSEMSASDKNAQALLLMQDAFQLLQGKDVSGAEPVLDKAKSLNAEQTGLWSMYGYLAFRRGDLPGAVLDYQKELKLHPSNTVVYASLIQAQVALKRTDEAKASLRQWQAADPADERPALELASMQMGDGDPAGAVKTVAAALAAIPDGTKKSERLELLLGRAQLKAGMKEQGHATLLAVVKGTDDPGMMNDAGYELADAGLELPLVEKVTRTALDQMEAESETWTLDESPATLKQKTQLLQATWDSMGWVYFREGRMKEAQEYVGASWAGRQSEEVGKHLGEIAEANGDKNVALMDYMLADATIVKYDVMGVHRDGGPEAKLLNDRMAALRKTGAKGTLPENALQKLRTIPIGAANGMNGVGEYRFLVSGDAVVKVKPSGEKVLAGGEQRMLKARLKGFTPAAAKGELMYTGLLNCHSGVCEVVLEP
jgi:transglutaminase-like putative cysteine protease/tetratricopeptide (TPR) repeat protein